MAKGYLPQAVINFIALLGWAPTGEQEIFTLDELKDAFSISGNEQVAGNFRWTEAPGDQCGICPQAVPGGVFRDGDALYPPDSKADGY